jgi:hypothetical protein
MKYRAIISGVALLSLLVGCSTVPRNAPSAGSPVIIKIPGWVAAKANSPMPPASATKKTSIGQGMLEVDTSHAGGDSDWFWLEGIDVDGDGNVEVSELLWDDESKMLFLYGGGELRCTRGGWGSGDLMIAVYGEGNPRGRPAGSGWYLVTLDAGECSANMDGAYGCRFDAGQTPTTCGMALVDAQTNDLLFATATN